MEALGGGGHLTMAGAQLENTDIRQAYSRLTDAIDRQVAKMQERT